MKHKGMVSEIKLNVEMGGFHFLLEVSSMQKDGHGGRVHMPPIAEECAAADRKTRPSFKGWTSIRKFPHVCLLLDPCGQWPESLGSGTSSPSLKPTCLFLLLL